MEVVNENSRNIILIEPTSFEKDSEEDHWEIISSKSIDNVNIEGEGNFKENKIILDYYN